MVPWRPSGAMLRQINSLLHLTFLALRIPYIEWTFTIIGTAAAAVAGF